MYVVCTGKEQVNPLTSEGFWNIITDQQSKMQKKENNKFLKM